MYLAHVPQYDSPGLLQNPQFSISPALLCCFKGAFGINRSDCSGVPARSCDSCFFTLCVARTSTYLMHNISDAQKQKLSVFGSGGCTAVTADMYPAPPLSSYSTHIHGRFHQMRLEIPRKLKRAPFVSWASGGNWGRDTRRVLMEESLRQSDDQPSERPSPTPLTYFPTHKHFALSSSRSDSDCDSPNMPERRVSHSERLLISSDSSRRCKPKNSHCLIWDDHVDRNILSPSSSCYFCIKGTMLHWKNKCIYILFEEKNRYVTRGEMCHQINMFPNMFFKKKKNRPLCTASLTHMHCRNIRM